MAEAQLPPALQHLPSAKEKKYDRQLRLWAASGQSALEDAHVLLVNSGSGTVGIETLKNLVLPGSCSALPRGSVPNKLQALANSPLPTTLLLKSPIWASISSSTKAASEGVEPSAVRGCFRNSTQMCRVIIIPRKPYVDSSVALY